MRDNGGPARSRQANLHTGLEKGAFEGQRDIAEIAALRAARSDMLLLWKWGAGGQVGTGFAEKLGGDGDGE
ncbi:MAG TPA: hypothetical protein PKV38_13270, partial [bacterium]|nr:hypothetical protein [bacterium]